MVLLLMATITMAASAQKTEKKEKNSPDEEISVKREFDEQGNLIRFDSLRVFRWSTDSLFTFPGNKGWESLFGEDLFEDLFPGLRNLPSDSSRFGDFFFHNDTSFFMGPNSSFMLPPGFFIPEMEDLEEMEELLERHFKSLPPGQFPDFGNHALPFQRYADPDQQKEWQQLMEKQHKEMEEFREKWEKKKQSPGIEKI